MPVTVVGPPLGTALQQSLERAKKDVGAALDETAKSASDEILSRGRADITGAGRFGTRWTEGLTAGLDSGAPNTVTITVRHAVPYWSVFEYGKTIHGKPLLWLPIGDNPRIKDWAGGRLFRVDRKAGGAPLLLSAADRQAKYSGHESVTIPKKFHLVQICHDVAGQLGQLYRVAASR